MNQYAKLEDELEAARGNRNLSGLNTAIYSVLGASAAFGSADAFEKADYKAGAFTAFMAVVTAIVCAGSILKLYEHYTNILRIQREIEYMKQEGLEKKVE